MTIAFGCFGGLSDVAGLHAMQRQETSMASIRLGQSGRLSGVISSPQISLAASAAAMEPPTRVRPSAPGFFRMSLLQGACCRQPDAPSTPQQACPPTAPPTSSWLPPSMV